MLDIFTQIIDFYLYLSKRFSDYSESTLLWESRQTFFFFVNIVFGQKLTKNAKNYQDILTPSIPEIIWVRYVRAIVVSGFFMKSLKKHILKI